MAEVQQQERRKKQGVRRSKKLSTKVDLTPMVDLGFLLITFFVFTTTISSPKVMKLTLPKESKDSAITPASKTISLLLATSNRIYYYNGDSINNMHEINYSPDGLRSVLINKRAIVRKLFGDALETVVLIKPTDGATYENMIDVFDEMQINNITRYVLMDANKYETAIVQEK